MAKTYSMVNQQGSVTLILVARPIGQSVGLTPVNGETLTLPITPEDIVIARPSRQAVIQTLTSAYQDHLGSGITMVTMRGHTGWRNLTPDGDGYTIINRLRDLLGKYDKAVARGRPDFVDLMLLLHLPAGWENFRVSKNTATFSRSRVQPLLYRYEIQFTVLRDMNDATGQVDPSGNFVIQPGIFPPVTLVAGPLDDPDPNPPPAGGTVTGTGDANDASNDARNKVITDKLDRQTAGDADAAIVASQTKYLRGTDRTGTGIASDLALIFPASGTTGMTLADFAHQQYPLAAGYPDNLWAYIVAANPEAFRGMTDPNTFVIDTSLTYMVPRFSATDARSARRLRPDQFVGPGVSRSFTNDSTNASRYSVVRFTYDPNDRPTRASREGPSTLLDDPVSFGFYGSPFAIGDK